MTKEGKTLPLIFDEDQYKYVTIRNDFHETAYHLDTFEQKLFFEVLARIDSFKGSDQTVSLGIKDLAKIGVSSTTLYRKFHEACDRVLALSLRFYSETEEDEDGNRIFEDRAINIFTEHGKRGVKSKSGKKVVHKTTFSINPKIAGYLTEITKDMRFTMILLEQTRNLKKAASIRLYQWLRKSHWINTNRTITTVEEITVIELIDKLDFNEKKITKRKNWRSFKRNILDPACEDINEQSDLHTWYELVRGGRGGKIQGVVFFVKNKTSTNADQQVLKDVTPEHPVNVELTDAERGIKMMLTPYLPNITDDMAKLIARHDHQVIFDSMLILTGKIAAGKAKIPESLFIGILHKRAKEVKEESKRKHQSTIEKLTDDSWAKEGTDLSIFDEMDVDGFDL